MTAAARSKAVHGTATMYRYGCRSECCREAERLRIMAWRHRTGRNRSHRVGRPSRWEM